MQENRNGIDFGWKIFISFFGLKVAGPDLCKISEKDIFWKSTNFMFISNNRPCKCKMNSIRINFGWKRFVSIFWLKAAGAGPVKKSGKKYILKIHKIYFHLQKQALEMQTNSIRINFGWKSFISFFGIKVAGADLWKGSEKNIFWKSTNFMFIGKSRPWKCKRTTFESFGWKSFISFFGLRHGPAKKSEKKIFWKSTNFMFNSNSRPWKCKRTEFESILVEKVSFHFLKAAGADLQKVLKKIILKIHKFYVNLKSRPWQCNRTAFESILAEKVSFHFLASGRRCGPVKKYEKNLFWKSTNFMFNNNSRPWKCKRTELESILVEKFSFHFLAQGRRPGPV